jgi:tetratricopeptide (TPR) repeat protein
MARGLNLIGAVHYVLGQYPQAERDWENALQIFQELGNRQQGMDLLNNLGAIADARGDHETAFQRYHSALEIAREIGYRDGEIAFLTNRGGEQVALRNYGAAESDLRQAIQMAGITGSLSMPVTFGYRAEALIGLGRYEDALYSAMQALFLGEEEKTPEYTGMAWRTLGMVSEKLRKPISLRDRETWQIISYDTDIEIERARTLREWAKSAFRRGAPERAEKMWQESREIFRKLGADLEVERMANAPA